jgi:hypothetical protein
LDVGFGARFFQANDQIHMASYNNRLVNIVNTILSPGTGGGGGGTGTTPLGFGVVDINQTPGFGNFNGVLDDLTVDYRQLNNVVGPQMLVRWSNQRGRWTFSTEGRFMAGANIQHGLQTTSIASRYFDPITVLGNAGTIGIITTGVDQSGNPVIIVTNGTLGASVQGAHNLSPLGSKVTSARTEFTPLGEIRFNTSYQLTKAFALHLGYSAMYAYGITRAANTIDYTLPRMGILETGARQNLFVNGLNFGIEFNR